jgi:N-acetylneuraminic acid mutarotase
MNVLSPLLLILLHTAVKAVNLPCSDPGSSSTSLSRVSDAPSGIIDRTIYVFPHICKRNNGALDSPCHYYCDQNNNLGWQTNNNVNDTISWLGAAYAVGELKDGTDALFMLGGTSTKKNKPLDNMVYYTPKKGIVTLPPLRYGALAEAAAVYLKPNLYLIGGKNSNSYNEKVFRFDTTTLTWLTNSLTPSGTFTPRVGLSAAILNGLIVSAGGHTGTGPSSRPTATFEVLEVDRTRGEDTALVWHSGPDMSYPRAYATMFSLNCKVYVAGGAIDNGKIE